MNAECIMLCLCLMKRGEEGAGRSTQGEEERKLNVSVTSFINHKKRERE